MLVYTPGWSDTNIELKVISKVKTLMLTLDAGYQYHPLCLIQNYESPISYLGCQIPPSIFNILDSLVIMLYYDSFWLEVISISLNFGGDYPCAHYPFVEITQLMCTLSLCFMIPYDITIGHAVASDIH